MDTNATKKRRSFLLGATLGGVGAAAAVIAGGRVEEVAKAVADTRPTKTKGYHVTPHIEQYYDTTRI